MFLTTVTLEQFAGLREDMTITSRTDDGMLMTTTGHHSELGAFVIVEGIAGFRLISTIPMRQSPGA